MKKEERNKEKDKGGGRRTTEDYTVTVQCKHVA
jgi:hypothetical protein